MLSQYLYISTAPSLSRDELNAVLATSARNNPARGVTGLLLYNGRNFLQLLEGVTGELDSLMARINRDLRHAGVSILHKEAIEERTCPEWAMKRVIIAESIANRRQLLEQDLPQSLGGDVRKMILNFAMLN